MCAGGAVLCYLWHSHLDLEWEGKLSILEGEDIFLNLFEC